MEMRDRLIELISKTESGISFERAIPEEFADYLIANGVILPPCKVGDTVYIIDEPDFEDDYVLDVKVNAIGQDKRGLWVSLELPLGMRLDTYVFPNNWGKTVFPTEEAAEKALKERGQK